MNHKAHEIIKENWPEIDDQYFRLLEMYDRGEDDGRHQKDGAAFVMFAGGLFIGFAIAAIIAQYFPNFFK